MQHRAKIVVSTLGSGSRGNCTLVAGERNGLLADCGICTKQIMQRMVEINIGAVDEARKVKPEIPLIGHRGVPIHDEIVMELRLQPYLNPA